MWQEDVGKLGLGFPLLANGQREKNSGAKKKQLLRQTESMPHTCSERGFQLASKCSTLPWKLFW